MNELIVILSKPIYDESADTKKDEPEEITELVFREPTIGDFIRYKFPDALQDVKSAIEIVAKLTGHRIKVIERMKPLDYRKCVEILNNFFLDPQEQLI